MPKFRSSTILMFLALFVAGIVATSLTPLVGSAHALGQDDFGLAQTDCPAAVADESPGDDGVSCNHGCHLLQHFQGNIERLFTLDLEPWSGAYAAAEPGVPPPLFLDTHLRPPRVPSRSV